MAEYVEARSLSDINFLAANPPQYPHSTEVRESLVLYISRVPGTRDIILSTFKPQKKNVTAEDVANSLYYVHLDSAADDLLAPSPQAASEISPRSSGESERSTIRRKPLRPVPGGLGHDETQISEGSASSPPLPRTKSPRPQSLYGSGFAAMTAVSQYAAPAEELPEGYRPNPMFQNKRRSQLLQPLPPPPPHAELRPPSPQSPVSPTSTIHRKPVVSPWTQAVPLSAHGARPSTPNSSSFSQPHREAPGPSARQPIPLSPPASLGYDPNPPPMLSSSSNPRQQPYQPYLAAQRSPSPNKMRSSRQQHSSVPFSLVLIRRDPASGQQWNVGRVSSFQTSIPTPELAGPDFDPANASDPRGPPRIDVHLDSTGYAKYRGLPTRQRVEEVYRPASASSAQPSLKDFSAAAASMDERRRSGLGAAGGTAAPTLSRQIMMTYSRSWAANIKHALQRRSHGHGHSRSRSVQDETPRDFKMSPPLPPPPPPRPSHLRQHSSSSLGASFDAFASAPQPAWDYHPSGRESPTGFGGSSSSSSGTAALITEPGPGLKPRGYVFLSPWDGRCEFRTGNGGRSLRCQHVLDAGGGGNSGGGGNMGGYGAGGNGSNSSRVATAAVQLLRERGRLSPTTSSSLAEAMAATAGGTTTTSSRGGGGGAKPVSELRFNLPGMEMGKHGDNYNNGQGRGSGGDGGGINKRFSRLLRSSDAATTSEEEDYEDEPMDLSLGRERAGGGNRGKRAKLGKLIVHDEGLKMLDLVVAANVGVWWAAWERSL